LEIVAYRIRVPVRGIQEALHAIGGVLAEGFGELPAILAFDLSSTFPICMEGLIRFPLAGSVVRDRAETFRISPLNTDMRKVGPGAYRVLRRPKKRCRQAVLARRLPIPDGYAADQMGKVELRRAGRRQSGWRGIR